MNVDESYASDNVRQIEAIECFARILSSKHGREVGFNEAAMVWVKESHAARYRHGCEVI